MKPASIRFNNPGAQYPGPSARKYGSTGTEIIGGGHKIAVFDNPVNGAAAQFDLLKRGYMGLTLGDAIRKWSGGNSSPAYANRVAQATGVSLDTPLTPDMINNPAFAIPFAKSAASWEAGQDYPMTDDQWAEAHRLAGGGQAQGSMNGGMGVSPTGSAGIAGPIHTADPTQHDIPSQFVDFKPQAEPATRMALGGPQSESLVMLDFNDANISDAIGQFGDWVGSYLSKMQPKPPSVDMAHARAPNVQISPNVVAALLQKRAKPGNRGGGGYGI